MLHLTHTDEMFYKKMPRLPLHRFYTRKGCQYRLKRLRAVEALGRSCEMPRRQLARLPAFD